MKSKYQNKFAQSHMGKPLEFPVFVLFESLGFTGCSAPLICGQGSIAPALGDREAGW